MYFDLMHITIRKHLKEIGFLNLFLPPKEMGTRHLLAFRWESSVKGDKKMFNIHWLFNWNHAWVISA